MILATRLTSLADCGQKGATKLHGGSLRPTAAETSARQGGEVEHVVICAYPSRPRCGRVWFVCDTKCGAVSGNREVRGLPCKPSSTASHFLCATTTKLHGDVQMSIHPASVVDPVSEVLSISHSLSVLAPSFPEGQGYVITVLADRLMSAGEELDNYMFDKGGAHEC